VINEIKTRAYYNTTSKYKLHDDASYTSLDTISVTTIHEFSENHIKLCGIDDSHSDHVVLSQLQKNVNDKSRSFIIGTKDGQWHQSKHVKQLFGDNNLNLIRQVTSYVIDESLKCHSIITENVLPLELFQYMRIESVGDHPFHTEYFVQEEAKKRSRDLAITDDMNMTPDLPILPCSSFDYGWFNGQDSTSSGSYNFRLTPASGCAQFSMKMPGSFNYNYDYSARQARSSINLGYGATCTNCYAFMGAGFMAIVEYSSWLSYGPLGGSHFYVEGKIQGGMGVNVDATVTPTSGTYQSQLFPAASSFNYLPLGGGLQLG